MFHKQNFSVQHFSQSDTQNGCGRSSIKANGPRCHFWVPAFWVLLTERETYLQPIVVPRSFLLSLSSGRCNTRKGAKAQGIAPFHSASAWNIPNCRGSFAVWNVPTRHIHSRTLFPAKRENASVLLFEQENESQNALQPEKCFVIGQQKELFIAGMKFFTSNTPRKKWIGQVCATPQICGFMFQIPSQTTLDIYGSTRYQPNYKWSLFLFLVHTNAQICFFFGSKMNNSAPFLSAQFKRKSINSKRRWKKACFCESLGWYHNGTSFHSVFWRKKALSWGKNQATQLAGVSSYRRFKKG